MKKLICSAIIASSMLFAGCGNGWEVTKKNFKSNYGELRRTITIYDSIAKTNLWTFTGVGYIEDHSGTKSNGNVSVIFRKNGEYKKIDVVGQHITVFSIEE